MFDITNLIELKLPLILASKSPRRNLLLRQLGFDFTIFPPTLDEKTIEVGNNAEKYAGKLALLKAVEVAENQEQNSIVIGADTIVVLDSNILNKPTDKDDAFRMLKTLSGRTHIVFTGIALVESQTMRSFSAVQETDVTFRELDDKEIYAYVETGSPLDKAGAYGIQDDFGAVFISNIKGCYYNIVGLPLELLYTSLKSFIRNTL